MTTTYRKIYQQKNRIIKKATSCRKYLYELKTAHLWHGIPSTLHHWHFINAFTIHILYDMIHKHVKSISSSGKLDYHH